MERTYIAQALTMAGQTVKVQGFVENNRNGKSMAFIVLKDITGKIQITVEKEKHPDLCPALGSAHRRFRHHRGGPGQCQRICEAQRR